MAVPVQVSCIDKRDRNNPHERIKGIGGVHGGRRWYLLEDDAIRDIEAGKFNFFVSAGGRVVDVVVASHNGWKYLKTTADGYAPNNLLSLASCPL